MSTAGSWTGIAPQPVPPPPETATARRTTIESAAARYLAEFSEHAALAMRKKYRLMLGKLKSFSAARGYVMIDQWGSSDMREFRSSWNVSLKPSRAA